MIGEVLSWLQKEKENIVASVYQLSVPSFILLP